MPLPRGSNAANIADLAWGPALATGHSQQTAHRAVVGVAHAPSPHARPKVLDLGESR